MKVGTSYGLLISHYFCLKKMDQVCIAAIFYMLSTIQYTSTPKSRAKFCDQHWLKLIIKLMIYMSAKLFISYFMNVLEQCRASLQTGLFVLLEKYLLKSLNINFSLYSSCSFNLTNLLIHIRVFYAQSQGSFLILCNNFQTACFCGLLGWEVLLFN